MTTISITPHLKHAACCVLFLLAYEARGMEHLDDRSMAQVGDAHG